MDSYDATVGPAHTLDLPTPTALPPSQEHLQEYQPRNAVSDAEQQQQPADFVTDPLKQLLLTDMFTFFQTEVAPRSAAINDVSRRSDFAALAARIMQQHILWPHDRIE